MLRILFICHIVSTLIFADSPIPAGAKLEKIATGFLQPEGPVWKVGVGLLFSDIKGNKIYRWNPADSSISVYLNPSDSSNGLTLDAEGRLILTQMRLRRVSRQETNGTITPLASGFEGKKFNSPNDLVVKSDGSIFFTDPDFNVPYPYKSELGYRGIYRLGQDGNVKLLDKTFDKPNGICFSPDEKKMYVNESPRSIIYVWDVINDSTIANKKVFYSIPANGYSDGMKTDPQGNLYCTGPTGVWIIAPDGTYLDKIAMSENPSNCNWGGDDGKSLFITAGKSLYRIKLGTTTGIEKKNKVLNEYRLYNNFPNPFNPSTKIRFKIFGGSGKTEREFVTLKVYDILGTEVMTLLNEEKHAGEFEIEFNAGNLQSGIYYYTLVSGGYSETRSMLYLK